MTQMNISQARQEFLQLINRAFVGEEFIITKNNLPMATILGVKKEKKAVKKKINLKAFGMWKNRKDFKGLSTIQIADRLREMAWKGNYAD